MLEIRLLGTFEIRDGENALNIASRPAQSLFAYLVLNAGTSHRREKLAGMLWPDSLEETARGNLRHALWRIRKALPARPGMEYLLTDDLSITFNASSEYWVRELLAHVAVWWEEARAIIHETIKHGEGPGRKYDFAVFNAAAIQRFQDTPEAEFMAWYEAERQRMNGVLSGLSETQLQIRRVQNWLNAVLLEHLKEHGCGTPRFLVIDTLHREWGDYVKGFAGLTESGQAAFLKKQGFDRFRDVLAHIIAWWEHGIGVIESSASEVS